MSEEEDEEEERALQRRFLWVTFWSALAVIAALVLARVLAD